MYYSDFDSFSTASSEARTFQLTVATLSGENHISSPIPIAVFDHVQKYVEEALEGRNPVAVWNRNTRAVISVPSANVKSVSLQFIA
jgi:hypothetical protein